MSSKEKAALYLQMGVRYMELNMLKTAKENLDIALDLDTNNAEIYNALGVIYERLNQNAVARQNYQKALAIDGNNYRIKNNYGRFLCARNQYNEGIRLLNEALKMPLNNRKWFAYTNIGLCELKNAKPTLAETNFRKALQSNSQYSPALLEMQKISYGKGKFLSARAFLERYLAVTSHTPESLWYAVQTERALGNNALVEKYKEQLFRSFPLSAQAKQLKTAVKTN